MNKINRDFYCSIDQYKKAGVCFGNGNGEKKCKDIRSICTAYHRKWPTPEQFKEEYGHEYPDDAAVYFAFPEDDDEDLSWEIEKYEYAKFIKIYDPIIICTCTPWGRPPADWRPE